jgi:hypothetical protein
VVEAAGVELDRLSEYGLILKNVSTSATLETVESLKILLDREVAPSISARNPCGAAVPAPTRSSGPSLIFVVRQSLTLAMTGRAVDSSASWGFSRHKWTAILRGD